MGTEKTTDNITIITLKGALSNTDFSKPTL